MVLFRGKKMNIKKKKKRCLQGGYTMSNNNIEVGAYSLPKDFIRYSIIHI